MKIIINEKTVIDQMVADVIIDFVKQKPNAVLGLATGSSPLGVYENLIKDYQNNQTSYQKVVTFNLDEYYGIDILSPKSYYSYMHEKLFNHLNINKNNIFFPSEKYLKNFSLQLEKNPVDIQILGVGSNGHIGFNEPYTPFDSTTSVVNLSLSTRKDNSRFFSSLSEVPKKAITMGLKEIIKAKMIIVLAFGKKKSKAIKALVDGKKTTKWPISILKDHPNVVLYLDYQAANLIK